MERDELITSNLDVVERAAGKLRRRGERLWDDLVSAGQEALIKAADAFNPDRPEFGGDFRSYACQRIRWAMLNVIDGHKSMVSLDAAIGHDGDGASIGSMCVDRNADDPAELAEVNEWKERNMPRGSLRLADCRVLTPKPEGVGAWAEKLRQAAFNAVSEHDITELMGNLLAKAKAGDMAAARLVLNYLTGGGAPRVQQVVVVQQGIQATPPAVSDDESEADSSKARAI